MRIKLSKPLHAPPSGFTALTAHKLASFDGEKLHPNMINLMAWHGYCLCQSSTFRITTFTLTASLPSYASVSGYHGWSHA